MKDYFVKLFDYDRYASEAILGSMLQKESVDKPVQLMAHLLTAQQVWLARCKGQPPVTRALWPDDQLETFADMINDNSEDWLNYLTTLEHDDFERIVHYRNTKGEAFQNKLSDILAHVINHGTHHRAQIGQQLKFALGECLPNTDYIFYIRQLNG